MMAARAHSSMAEQPAHNRLDLGSRPGGPTVVAGAASPAYSVGGLRRGAVWLRPARHFSFHRAASPAYSVGGLRRGAVWLRPARHFSFPRAASPAYSVGGLRRGAVWLRPARHFSFHRAASPAYSVGGLSQLRVAPHPQTTRAVARRVAPVRGQSEGVWIHSSLR